MTSGLRLECCEGTSHMKIGESAFQAKPTASEGGHETGIMLIGSRNIEKRHVDGI